MKKIESMEDLKLWIQRVNSGNSNKAMCDLQDVFAHSEEKELVKFFLSQDVYEKELTAFCIGKAMGQEKLFRFMKSWAREQAHKVIEENEVDLGKRFDQLNKERYEFEMEKQNAAKRLATLKAENKRLHELVDHKDTSLEKEHAENGQLYKRQLELENELDELNEACEKHVAFRTYLKEVLMVCSFDVNKF